TGDGHRPSASRPSGEWNDDDFDVLCDGVGGGRIMKARVTRRYAVALDARLWAAGRPHANAWLRADAPGCYGLVRQELAARVRWAGVRRGSVPAGFNWSVYSLPYWFRWII